MMENMADAQEVSWRSQSFRQNVRSKIEEAIRQSGNPTQKSVPEMESHVFQKAKTREEYLGYVARLIIHVREMSYDCKARKSLSECYPNVLQKTTKLDQVRFWHLKSLKEYLRPFICAQGDQITNFESLSNDEVEDTSQRSTLQSLVSENLGSSPTRNEKRKQKITPMTEILKEYLNKKERLINTDHLMKFFQSLGETVRTFPPHLQVKIRSRFSSIVYNAQCEVIAASQNSFVTFPSPSSITTPSTFSSFPGDPNSTPELLETSHSVLRRKFPLSTFKLISRSNYRIDIPPIPL